MNLTTEADPPATDEAGHHRSRKSRGGFLRSTGAVSLIVAIASAIALTGAAFATVTQASCEIPGHYVQQAGQLEFVGGCVSTTDLVTKDPALPQPHSVTNAVAP